MRIGLLGGTFNPIHNGHLHIAEEVLDYCRLDQVWFVPSCSPPHKSLAGEVSFAERLAMVRAAIAGNEHFSACDVEGRRGGPVIRWKPCANCTVNFRSTSSFLSWDSIRFRRLPLERIPATFRAGPYRCRRPARICRDFTGAAPGCYCR